MKAALSTSSLSIGYRHGKSEKTLFENLNLDLNAGEMVCFMGPNGIGKSSLIRTLAGFQNALSGEIKLSDESHNRAELISVVLTDKVTPGNMTAYDLVAFGRYPYLGWN